MVAHRTVKVNVDIGLDVFDDDDLKERLEGRGFYVAKITSNDDWFEIPVSEWQKLATYIALGETQEALDLIEYLSNGTIDAICAANYAKTMNQGRVAA